MSVPRNPRSPKKKETWGRPYPRIGFRGLVLLLRSKDQLAGYA